MLLGISGEITPERMKGWSQDQKLELTTLLLVHFLLSKTNFIRRYLDLEGLQQHEESWFQQTHTEIPVRRSHGEGNGNPLQYSCLENSMDRGTWWATVHGVTKSQTQLSIPTLQGPCGFLTPLPVPCQVPLSMEFSRQEYRTG